MNKIKADLAGLGSYCMVKIRNLGKLAIFNFSAILLIFRPPFKIERIIRHLYFIGVVSIFVVSLTALFTGMVLGLQGYYTLSKFGSEGLLGSAVALSLIRELGPVMAALMVTGRAGSSIAANIGTMRISEQIDALDTMDINPIAYLVSPRIVASIISMPMLTAIFDLVGILGGYLSGVVILGVNPGVYFNAILSSTKMADIVCGLVKPLFFGFIIASISCYRGYFCHKLRPYTKGTEGVSFATTSSVVIVSVSILVVDYVLTAFLL